MPTSRQRVKSYPINVINYCGHFFETPITAMMKEVNISELFEYYGKGRVKSLTEAEDGPYPCISCSAVNNGASKYINTYDYDTETLGFPLLTVPGDGDIYQCFVQHDRFSAQTSVHILKLKNEDLNGYLGMLAFLMSARFGDGSYNYHLAKLNKERLMKETILLPVVVEGIDKETLKKITDGETTLSELTNEGKNKDYAYEINTDLLTNFVYTMMM